MRSVSEICSEIRAADKVLRDTGELTESKELNITRWYNIAGGVTGPTPFSGKLVSELELFDRTADPAWEAHFLGSAREIGIYRSNLGGYWLLRYESAFREHWLEQVGTVEAVAKRFGGRG